MTKDTVVYDELMSKYKEIVLLESVNSIMGWDTEVYIPPAGFPLRGEQMALLGKLRHRMFSRPEIGKLLDKAESKAVYGSLDEVQQRNIYLLRREYDAMVKMPEELVAAFAKQQTKTVQTWKQAKAKKDWKMFEPELQALFDLVVKRADILMKVRDTPTPYDALLDLFEPKMTQTTISKVFTDLRNDLIPLVDKYSEASKAIDTAFMKRKVPTDVQRKIGEALCKFILFDTTSDKAGGRVDETEHPFTTGYFDDVRITTHYYEDNFASSFYSVLHEGGHALYGQNHDPKSKFLPWGDASSYGIHESQSRFVENMVGRSKEFITYFLPVLNKLTNNTFKGIKVDQFTKAMNQVKRSKIRIEADEVTYSLHVIVRFEIEKALFANKVKISELPSIWNEKYDKYLGVKIDHDSEGVMQDTHWASGYHGYFPSYALGNIYGGQFLVKMEQDIPNWLDLVAKGKFAKIKQWMVENVHRRGNLYNPEDLVKVITGEGLNAKPFIDYLTVKYKRIFET